jgi:hypothetical protein
MASNVAFSALKRSRSALRIFRRLLNPGLLTIPPPTPSLTAALTRKVPRNTRSTVAGQPINRDAFEIYVERVRYLRPGDVVVMS